MLCNFYFTKGNGFFESSSIETVKFRKVRNKIIDLKNNKTSLYKTETLYQEIIKMKNAADRNRTGTGITTQNDCQIKISFADEKLVGLLMKNL